ncbi:LysR family transcriptional regulator for bpeEF and oprC [Pseudochelatococcus lubricantis]|uniref:LysR family transcriptional regulator for bpeEF and oprC n=1 Tax=Pseudochelatococcus lubricantis TaxID=1538102 RepID=A0ABX0V2W2_9HYPH|nr:LysR family transcriptional regulator [Pseudochelatococcus lubricantis]NIJ59277.1 LysR family transcriptional regulator for bpeEF and oprC [Pseudochelatococcus lubricantis]
MAALQFFVRVVESGSFSQAARELGVGQPAVSKQIAALEQRLKAQLLNRTSRRLRLTPAGVDFYEAAIRILGELDDAESRAANAHEQPNGTVRVATPPLLTGMMIVPTLPEFFLRFPSVTVEFVVSERYADLVQEGLDLAIRIGKLDSSGLLARRVGSMQVATIASPKYLARHGVPLKPSDLDAHHLLANRYLGAISNWHFKNSEREIVTPASGRFSCNNPADTHAAVLAGLGIVQSARALFEAELRSGDVVELLGDFTPEPIPIHAIYGSARVPQRVRVVSDFITQCLDRHASLRLQ